MPAIEVGNITQLTDPSNPHTVTSFAYGSGHKQLD
jgi:hypothetical protein